MIIKTLIKLKKGGEMKSKIMTLLLGFMFMFGMAGVYAYDASTPYTVTVNYIVGEDTSFTIALAGVETTIDFNPTTLNDKEVEPNSQVAETSTPILTITNTGNVNLDFSRGLNTTNPAWVVLSMNNANSVDWTQIVNDTFVDGDTVIASASTSEWYFWANFTAADSGTTQRLLQINSSTSV